MATTKKKWLPPDIIDNTAETLASVLSKALEDPLRTTLKIATGYFERSGFSQISKALANLEVIQIILGKEPEPKDVSTSISFAEVLRNVIRNECDRLLLDKKNFREIERFLEWLKNDAIEIRHFKKNFLHAKAYLMDDLAIVGSSNFTFSGLTKNNELNITRGDAGPVRALHEWFEKKWAASVSCKELMIEAYEFSKFGTRSFSPYEVFLKVLYERLKDKLALDSLIETVETRFQLISFQREGAREAIALLERYGAALVADAVGLGKTYTAMRVLEHFLLEKRAVSGPRKGIVICPAQVRDTVWLKKLPEYGIPAQVLSYEEAAQNPERFSSYDIIVIDESHNLRNPNTQRYEEIKKLIWLGNPDKKVLLLTATPINNTPFDLYHQLHLAFKGKDTIFFRRGIHDLESYFRSYQKNRGDITPLLELTTIRHSRYDLRKRIESGEEIILDEGKPVRLPKPNLHTIQYSLEKTYPGVYKKLVDEIESLNFPIYNLERYTRKASEQQRDEAERKEVLIGILKTNLFKRLESSVAAIRQSLRRLKESQQIFHRLFIDEQRIVSSKIIRKILDRELEEEYEEIKDILKSVQKITLEDYDLDKLLRDVNADEQRLEKMIQLLPPAEREEPKFVALKSYLVEHLKNRKVLLFSCYKDTVNALFDAMEQDQKWKEKRSGFNRIAKLTGETSREQRKKLVERFSPKANGIEDDINEIDILICTDILSEGQNLQDAADVVNVDLHWNPVRLIQRAGRIDRINTVHEQINITNIFPEEALEEILRIIKNLMRKFADIEQTIGLDSPYISEEMLKPESVLGKLKKMQEARKEIYFELERENELPSLDEMKYPLQKFFSTQGEGTLKSLPLGIYSEKKGPEDGVFVAVKCSSAEGEVVHDWYFYPTGKKEPRELGPVEGLKFIRCSEQEEVPAERRKIPYEALADAYARTKEKYMSRAENEKLAVIIKGKNNKALLKLLTSREIRRILDESNAENIRVAASENKFQVFEKDIRLLQAIESLRSDEKDAHAAAITLLQKMHAELPDAKKGSKKLSEGDEKVEPILVAYEFVSTGN